MDAPRAHPPRIELAFPDHGLSYDNSRMTYRNDGREHLFAGHTGRIFILLTVILVFLQLTTRLLPPLLPLIIDDLGITSFLAGIALTMLRISRALTEYPSGRFADQLSRSTVILVCLGFVIAGVATISLAISYPLFLVGVVIFGLGLGLYSPASRALLSDIFEKKRGRAFGLHMMGNDLSGVLAAVIAIWVASLADWRIAFSGLLFILILFPLVFYRASREPIRVGGIDIALGETVSRLLEDPSIRWILVIYSLFVLASSGMISFLPTFLIEVHGASFSLASSAFALVFAVGLLSKPSSGLISDWVPRELVGGACLVIAAGGLAVLVTESARMTIIAGVAIYALGQRGVPPALQAFLMDRFPDGSMAGDLGAMRAFYMTLGSLGPSYTGFMIERFGFVLAYSTLSFFFLTSGSILFWLFASGRMKRS